MHRWIPFFTFMLLLSAIPALGFEVSEEERLRGFAEHNRRKQELEKQRETGIEQVKKKRETWEKEREAAVGPYKVWKSKQGTAPDENSPEYKQDQQAKKKREEELEKARLQYVQERNAKRARRSKVLLTEEEEYGLTTSFENRVEVNKRSLEGGKPSSSSGRGRNSGMGMGSADFGSPPPMDYSSPPPPPPPPEFYEPEIPPPPPPDAGFEDPIPPPVFDEPGDF